MTGKMKNSHLSILLIASYIVYSSADGGNNYNNYYPPPPLPTAMYVGIDKISHRSSDLQVPTVVGNDKAQETQSFLQKFYTRITSVFSQMVDIYFDRKKESKESIVSKFLYFTVMGKEVHALIENLRNGRQLTLKDVLMKSVQQISNMNQVKQSVADNIQSYSVSEAFVDSLNVANLIREDIFSSNPEVKSHSRKLMKRRGPLQRLTSNRRLSAAERMGSLISTGRMLAVAGSVSFLIGMAFSISSLARQSNLINWDSRLPVTLDELHSIITSPLYMVETVIDSINGIGKKSATSPTGVGIMDIGKDYLKIYQNAKDKPECIRYNLCRNQNTAARHNDIFLVLMGFVKGDRKISKYLDDIQLNKNSLYCQEDPQCSNFLPIA